MIIYYDSGKKGLFRQYFIENGQSFSQPYRSLFLVRADWKLNNMIHPKSLVYCKPESRKDDDKIIIFDAMIKRPYVEWICRQFPDKRVIFWFWNPVADIHMYDGFPERVEFWSYSPADCGRYGFRENTQFYFDTLAHQGENTVIRNTDETPKALFIGREKNRSGELKSIACQLEEAGAVTELQLIRSGWDNINNEQLISYEEVLKKVEKADILIDHYVNPDAGLSLRPLEAMYWRKKLITNNRRIKNCPLYDPNNIFVVGEESRDLRTFLREPLHPVKKEIREYYLFSNWLKRFDS